MLHGMTRAQKQQLALMAEASYLRGSRGNAIAYVSACWRCPAQVPPGGVCLLAC